MFAVTSPSEPALSKESVGISHVRVSGGVHVKVAHRGGASVIAETRERDGYKVRFPRRTNPPEAILINTGGGIASGDEIHQDFEVDADADLIATTQASERVYRSQDGATARLAMHARVGQRAGFYWLPQETILFDNARMTRRIDVDMDATSRVLLAETVVLGRTAMGETVKSGLLRDTWRVSRGGSLAFAENVTIDDATLGAMAKPAIASGAHVILTAVLVSADAGDRIGPVKEALGCAPFLAAASAWNGLLVVRGLAHRSEDAHHLLAQLMPILSAPHVPRVWWT